MAEKGFGVKEVNLIGASGTPTITSPNNLNLNANNVAISTNVSIGGTLSVTGNVSIGGTLTYEDVTNIDSVGIVTAREGVFIPDSKELKIGNTASSPDLKIYHNTSNTLIENSTGQLALNNSGGNISIKATDSNGDFILRVGGSTSSENAIVAVHNGEVILSFNGNTKLTTTNTGVTVTGTAVATTFSGSGASLTNLPAANLTGTLPAISGANLTNLPADTPTNSDIQVAYTVTANGSSAYRFAGNGVVSTADDPDLYLIRGQKYRFINNSGGSHPFQIRVASGGAAYSTGVTNNGAASGNIDFAPTFDSPAQLVYQCTSHGGMVGNIYLRDAAGGNTNVGVTTFSGGITVSGNTSFAGGNVTMTASGSPNSLNVSGTSRFEIASIENAEIDGEIAHSGDSDTKISFDTNTINLHSGGTTGLTVLDASVRVPTKLGINGAAPQTPLDVIADGSGYAINVRGRSSDNIGEIRFTSNNYGTLYGLLQTGATYLKFDVGGNERLRITNTGRINIGDADQTQNTDQLSVAVAAQNALDNVARFQSNAAASGTSESLVKIYKGAGYGGVISGYITQGSDHGMKFYTADNGSLTERLRISKPGHITMPHNPAFHARPPGNYTISGGSGIIGGTWSTSDPESFVRGTLANGNSIWDNSTGIFTVPVTGIYYINWSVFLTNNTTRRDAYIYRGSTAIARTEIGDPGEAGNNKSVSVSTVVSLTVNDEIKFAALTTGGTTIYTTARPWSYACAYLVG